MKKTVKASIILILLLVSLQAREYSLQEKLSQMFILGFKGTTYQKFKTFNNNNWGGYIFYSNKKKNINNFNQIQKLLDQIKGPQEDTKIKPFLSVDQEGGRYQMKLPNQKYFSAPLTITKKEETKTQQWAQEIASMLKKIGFNMNLAPVVDINKAPYKNNRTFGSNPKLIVDNSKLFIQAHHKQQIATTLKHFPGRGNGTKNSLNNSYNEKIDLEPFKKLIKKGLADIIMISYLKFPQLDPDNSAILSKKINKLLRKKLRFLGVIITDDLSNLNPHKLSDKELTELICNLIKTGNDLLLFANNNQYDQNLSKRLKKVIGTIIANEMISERRIEKSFQRILDLKQKYDIEPKEIYLNYNI